MCHGDDPYIYAIFSGRAWHRQTNSSWIQAGKANSEQVQHSGEARGFQGRNERQSLRRYLYRENREPSRMVAKKPKGMFSTSGEREQVMIASVY